MADQNIVNYIKQNLSQGFSEEEIRQALRLAGWPEQEIAQAFAVAKPAPALHLTGGFSRDKGQPGPSAKKVISALVILVVFPILGIGSFFLYQNFGPRNNQNATPSAQNSLVSGQQTSNNEIESVSAEQLQKQDTRRLKDIADIQAALEKYFERSQMYPQKLSDLLNDGLLAQIPTDPKNGDPYLYSTFGNPALHYFIAWILETDIGTLKAGLQTASSENIIPVQNFLAQQSVVAGETNEILAQETLTVTNLSVLPFYPQEEVTLEIDNLTGKTLASAILTIENSYINLTDTKPPFRFRFSAPRDSGQYKVNVYAFDEDGTSYFQKTSLIVK